MKFEDQFEWPSQLGMTPNLNDYMYTGEVKRMREMFDRFNVPKKVGGKEINIGRTFAVVGERGSGKTTFLNALKSELDSTDKYFTLPAIEPSVFSDNLNVLEAVLAVLQIELERQLKNAKPECNINADRLKQDILDVTESIQGIRVKRAEYAKSESPRDYLMESVDFHQLTEKMMGLFATYRQTISSIRDKKDKIERLVILVDDLDMVGSEHIYQAWMDLQNILAKTELYIVLTYREIQVQKVLLGHVIRDNEVLINHQQTTDFELTQQVAFMIDKQVPEQQKITLVQANVLLSYRITRLVQGIFKGDKNPQTSPRVDLKDCLIEMLGLKVDSSLNAQNIQEDLLDTYTAKEWISLFMHTNVGFRWEPVATYEQVSEIWPQSMREFVNFFHILTRIADNRDSAQNGNNSVQILRDLDDTTNLVEGYLLDSADKYLPLEAAQLVHYYSSAVVSDKNQIFYDFLYGAENQIRRLHLNSNRTSVPGSSFRYLGMELQINSIDFTDHPIIIPSMNSRGNVSMGDIMELCWILETQLANNAQLALLIVIMKRLYSNALRRSLLISKKWVSKYKSLINGLIMPFGYNYFSRSIANLLHQNASELSIVKPYPMRNISLANNNSSNGNTTVAGNSQANSQTVKELEYKLFGEFVYSSFAVSSRSNRIVTPHSGGAPGPGSDISGIMQISDAKYFLDMRIKDILKEIDNANIQTQTFPGKRFHIDFFSWLAKPEYLEYVDNKKSSIYISETRFVKKQATAPKKNISFTYILRDVMDVDLFIRKRYLNNIDGKVFGDGTILEKIFKKITEVIRETRQIQVNNENFLLINSTLYLSDPKERIEFPDTFALSQNSIDVFSILEKLIIGPQKVRISGRYNKSMQKFENNFFDIVNGEISGVKKTLSAENVRFLTDIWENIQETPNVNTGKLAALREIYSKTKADGSGGKSIKVSSTIENAISTLYQWLRSMRPLDDGWNIPNLLKQIINKTQAEPGNVTIRDDHPETTDILKEVWSELTELDVPDYEDLYPEINDRIQADHAYTNLGDKNTLNYAVGRLYYASLGKVSKTIDWGDL